MSEHDRKRNVAVLIVEDEPLLRMDACALIEEAGYKVYEAESADEAVRLLEGNDEVGLIFTDIQMPGSMDGLALAHYVRERWPLVKVIVTSGRIKLATENLPPGAIFIPKPYRSAEIASQVKELVAS